MPIAAYANRKIVYKGTCDTVWMFFTRGRLNVRGKRRAKKTRDVRKNAVGVGGGGVTGACGRNKIKISATARRRGVPYCLRVYVCVCVY